MLLPSFFYEVHSTSLFIVRVGVIAVVIVVFVLSLRHLGASQKSLAIVSDLGQVVEVHSGELDLRLLLPQ